MKKTLLIFAVSVLTLNALAHAQAVDVAVRFGGGLVAEDGVAGGGGAVDVGFSSAPLVLSPYVERYSQEGLARTYYGLNVLYTPSLKRSGFYLGAGVGSDRLSSEGEARNSLVLDALLGFRRMLSKTVGLYGEGKFYWNAETSADTDRFNDADFFDFNDSVPFALYDNDIVAIVGIFLSLR